jgi:hypothetical protein
MLMPNASRLGAAYVCRAGNRSVRAIDGRSPVPSGIDGLDRLLDGGWPQGAVLEWTVSSLDDAAMLVSACRAKSSQWAKLRWAAPWHGTSCIELLESDDEKPKASQIGTSMARIGMARWLRMSQSFDRQGQAASGESAVCASSEGGGFPPTSSRAVCWAFEQALGDGLPVIGWLPEADSGGHARTVRRFLALAQRHGGTAVLLRHPDRRELRGSGLLRVALLRDETGLRICLGTASGPGIRIDDKPAASAKDRLEPPQGAAIEPFAGRPRAMPDLRQATGTTAAGVKPCRSADGTTVHAQDTQVAAEGPAGSVLCAGVGGGNTLRPSPSGRIGMRRGWAGLLASARLLVAGFQQGAPADPAFVSGRPGT